MLIKPDGAHSLLVLAHGAGAGARHPFMVALAEALAREGVATLRFDFPYIEAGSRRPDQRPVLVARLREACEEGRTHRLPLFAGGKSMGGRMTSLAEVEAPLGVHGIVFVGFPLHPARQPTRADERLRGGHLADVKVPMLFLQGTRDELADLDRMRALADSLGDRSVLHVVEDADHSFHVRARSGRTDAEVLADLARTTSTWMQGSRSSVATV